MAVSLAAMLEDRCCAAARSRPKYATEGGPVTSASTTVLTQAVIAIPPYEDGSMTSNSAARDGNQLFYLRAAAA
jgi:hypothetical protein